MRSLTQKGLMLITLFALMVIGLLIAFYGNARAQTGPAVVQKRADRVYVGDSASAISRMELHELTPAGATSATASTSIDETKPWRVMGHGWKSSSAAAPGELEVSISGGTATFAWPTATTGTLDATLVQLPST